VQTVVEVQVKHDGRNVAQVEQIELLRIYPESHTQMLVPGSREKWPTVSQLVQYTFEEQVIHPVINAGQAPQPAPSGV
jgi:hypothetical protein